MKTAKSSYKYRGLPCNIQPDDKLWCVSGSDTWTGASGVLEWCYNEGDANSVKEEMSKDRGRFILLTASKYEKGMFQL